MTHTRLVWLIVHDRHGEPAADCAVRVDVERTTITAHAVVPGSVPTWPVSPIGGQPVATDDTGWWEVALEVGVPMVLTVPGANIVRGSSVLYPPGKPIRFTVPDGDGPISLMTILAADHPDPADPTLPNIVAGLESALDSHVRDWDNPHDVTASQLSDLDTAVSAVSDVAANTAARHTHANADVLDAITAPYTVADDAKLDGIADGATANATDAALRDRATHTGEQPIATVTGLHDALDSKQDRAALGSAAYTDATDYATAAQGQTADTAVQPGDLAAVATSGDKADVGLGNADNTSDDDKPVSVAQQAALDAKADDADLTAHTGDTDNPHSVTAAQVDAYTQGETDTRIAVKQDAPETAGQWYQTLRHGVDGPEWGDAAAPVPLAVVTPQGSADRSGPLTVTPSASVEVRDGAWWLCEGTVNTWPNPSWEDSSIAGLYQPRGAGMSFDQLTRSTNDAWHGAYSYRVETTGTHASQGVNGSYSALPATTGQTWTVSISIKGLANVLFGAQERLATGAYQGEHTSVYTPNPAIWTRLVKTMTTVGTDTAFLAPFWDTAGVMVAGAHYVDAIQLEQKPYPTPFVIGTRVDGTLTIPHATRPASILVRHRVPDSGTVTTSHLTLDGNDRATFGTDGVGVIEWDGDDLIVRTTDADLGYARQIEVLGVATFAEALPIYPGIIVTPSRWTFGGMGYAIIPPYPTLPYTIAGYYPPNKQIVVGGATLRTAPGTTAQTIVTLAAAAKVHDTGTRATASSVEYALLQTTAGGSGWVDATKLTALA